MAKKVRWIPNLRVDIPDIEQGTHGYGDEVDKEKNTRFIKDSYPRISDGFRVEIADQGTNPGQFTIVNGYAFDQSGQPINNENDFIASRSATLSADATYYVEIQFTENESDIDGRGFWDPRFDNGLDPSGDPRPDGREFARNVSTRNTLDWQIVTPISTTDFEINTVPNSTRIPVAILTRSGGVITGVSTTPARTVLLEPAAILDTTIRVVDSRIFPDSFTLDLDITPDDETITVNANDRENGILTLASGLTKSHLAGARCVNGTVSPPVFLNERTTPSPVIPSTDGDARPKFWQGNEETGYALSQDQYSNTGFSDLQTRKLKDYVDFLAAQIREIKFGSGRASDIGNLGPPSTFAAAPRYYERSGGIVSGRGFFVSVGDGVNTWGDFNTTQSGSAQAALQAAIDSLPTEGGIVYIKRGTYDITTTTLTINKNCLIYGDGKDATLIRSTDAGGTAAVTAGGAGLVIGLEKLTITTGPGGTASHNLILLGADPGSTIKDCAIEGINSSVVVQQIEFSNCVITNNSQNQNTLQGKFLEALWLNCEISALNATNTTLNVSLTESTNCTFSNCTFIPSTTTQDFMFAIDATSNRITVDNCRIQDQGGSTTGPFFSGASGATNIRILDTQFDQDGGVGTFTGCSDVWLTGCEVRFDQNLTGAVFTSSCARITIADCLFTQDTTTGAAGTGVCLDFTSATQVSVSNCLFIDADIGIQFNSLEGFNITNCQIRGVTPSRGRVGILADGTAPVFRDATISNCLFKELQIPTATNYGGIFINTGAGAANIQDIQINNCTFSEVGVSGGTNSYGINIDPNGGSRINLNINNCAFTLIECDTISHAISIDSFVTVNICNNQFRSIGTFSTTGSARGIIVNTATELVITGNQFKTIGNSSSGAGSSVIKTGTSGLSEGEMETAIISNNTVDLFSGTSSSVNVVFDITETFEKLTISGNVINPPNVVTGIRAIFVEGGATGGPDISDITITNNVIVGQYSQPIQLDLNDATADQDGRVCVSNNVINGFDNIGIQIDGAGIASTKNITVNNNTIFSTQNSVTGIRVQNLALFTAVGNNIRFLTGTGTMLGIHAILNVDTFSVTGNVVNITPSAGGAFGIDMSSGGEGVICGNHVLMSGTASTIGINATSPQFVAGNVAEAISGTANIQGTAFSRARKDSDGDGNPDNTSLANLAADIGLNYRP